MTKLHKNILPALAGTVFIIVVGFMLFFGKGANPPLPQKSTLPKNNIQNENAMKEFAIYLKPQNNSKQTGSASILEKNGKVIIGITTTGEPKNVIQFAQVRTGTCDSLGDIKYPLTNIVAGSSETTLDTTILNLQNSEPLALNINKTQEGDKNSVSCANLEFNNSASPTSTKEPIPNLNY